MTFDHLKVIYINKAFIAHAYTTSFCSVPVADHPIPSTHNLTQVLHRLSSLTNPSHPQRGLNPDRHIPKPPPSTCLHIVSIFYEAMLKNLWEVWQLYTNKRTTSISYRCNLTDFSFFLFIPILQVTSLTTLCHVAYLCINPCFGLWPWVLDIPS